MARGWQERLLPTPSRAAAILTMRLSTDPQESPGKGCSYFHFTGEGHELGDVAGPLLVTQVKAPKPGSHAACGPTHTASPHWLIAGQVSCPQSA